MKLKRIAGLSRNTASNERTPDFIYDGLVSRVRLETPKLSRHLRGGPQAHGDLLFLGDADVLILARHRIELLRSKERNHRDGRHDQRKAYPKATA
jgi:hypothetical protein